MFIDLVRIGFPANCLSCSNSLANNELFICSNCYFYLPKGELAINTKTDAGSLFEEYPFFLGAGHLFDFDKEGKIQQVIHELKYNSNIKFGEHLGSLMGSEFKEILSDIDYLVPVPLHPKKEHQRGFNQSLVLCQGINTVLNTKVSKKNLIRTRYTETQTKKNKLQRLENIKEAFSILDKKEFENKHVLLVDDVVTTGSTLNECLKVLRNVKGIKTKVLVLAKATH